MAIRTYLGLIKVPWRPLNMTLPAYKPEREIVVRRKPYQTSLNDSSQAWVFTYVSKRNSSLVLMEYIHWMTATKRYLQLILRNFYLLGLEFSLIIRYLLSLGMHRIHSMNSTVYPHSSVGLISAFVQCLYKLKSFTNIDCSRPGSFQRFAV